MEIIAQTAGEFVRLALVLAILAGLTYLVFYLGSLAARLVKAVEKIADRIGSTSDIPEDERH